MTDPLVDAPARDRIEHDTDATLFVNAGAGSGKTTALVHRVRSLVLDDGVPLRHIAAVTFTEKAGGELRDRLREVFETSRGAARAAADEALGDLDSAAIGTLHAFAQRILTEHPIEARLPPLVEVLDEVGSSVAFEERWGGLQTALLDSDEMAEPLLLGLALGVQLKHVRSLALFLGRDWDLIDERVLVGTPEVVNLPDLGDIVEQVQAVADLRALCQAPEVDLLVPKLDALEEQSVLLAGAPDVESQLGVLNDIAAMKFNHGQAPNWEIPVTEVRQAGNELARRAGEIVAGVRDQCLRRITRWVGERVLEAAEARRAEGRLEFHDLLVLTRNLLRTSADVRAALHDRYQRLLLDEVQDTDPIQIELAVRIAGGATAAADDWHDVEVPEGRLFVVGDPKQSIYRFRRASIATYLDAQDHLGEQVSLTSNFRTVAPILDWVNDVFGAVILPSPGAQPAYEPLGAVRDMPAAGPAVTVLGADAHTDLPRAAASLLREREAADVAAVVRQALVDEWQVFDQRLADDTGEGWRPARHDDIAVLVPSRTSLPFLEDALDDLQIPYRAEASSLVYQAAEVRSLLAAARAIADATDGLALVQALRSPLFGCGDDDLWRWKQAGGSFTVNSRVDGPETDGPVGSALAYLQRLQRRARWLTPSEVLGALVVDRRMLEVAATGPRARDSWRRLRFVIDQARAWSEVSHGGLRAFVAWAAHQGQETTRVAEAVLPETDADSVKIMTIHAAKGLEFPIVVMSGMTSLSPRARGVQLLWPATGGYAVRLASGVQTGDFDAVQPVDEQMDRHEKLRLLYVAATRARDHLVVSLHRADGSSAKTAAASLAEAGAVTAGPAVAFDSAEPVRRATSAAAASVGPPPDHDDWLARVETARARSRAVAATVASGLEGTEPEIVLADETPAGGAKGPRDLDLPPWTKGRYGSAVGRAVHAVLQVVDLGSGSGVDQAVRAQCAAEGVLGEEWLVGELVDAALGSDLVARAATRDHWRETYVGTTRSDGTVLEGYVDLIFRDDDGSLVVVDYKTDAIPAGAVASRVTYYTPQMAAYRECLEEATGLRVRTVLLFLNPEFAHAEEVGPVPNG